MKKCFLKNIIHSDDDNEQIFTKEIRLKIKCINLYLEK